MGEILSPKHRPRVLVVDDNHDNLRRFFTTETQRIMKSFIAPCRCVSVVDALVLLM